MPDPFLENKPLQNQPLQNRFSHSESENPPRIAPDLADAVVRKHYSARLLFYILFVILLSFLDAFFTLLLLYLGAAEINPVMAFFLQFGPTAFMAAKYTITAVCVTVMILGATRMGKAGNRLADRLFLFLAAAFGIVIVWELYLLFNALQ